jgi:phage terminase large subunit-like protein
MHAGRPFKLRPWQKAIIKAIYETSRRREVVRPIRQALITVPRQNGRTQLAAALALCQCHRDFSIVSVGMTGIRLCKWCVANTVTISNPSGARKPAKDRSTGRIRRPCGCGYGLWIGS